MHSWGDEDFPHFEDVENAASYIGRFCRRFGRINVRQDKEKYGTVRVYCNLGWSCLLNITHPGYCHYRPFPQWLMKFDINYGDKIAHVLNYVIYPYHKWVYNLAYQRAIKKWPHIRTEILVDADSLKFIDNCDDIKVMWTPPQYSSKDKKRLGIKDDQ